MPNELDLLVAHIALDEKFITQEQLGYCLRQMVMLERAGNALALGEMLVRREFLTAPQLQTLQEIRAERGWERLIEGYEITGVLGQGAMGCVYLGRQLSMDRPVALKILDTSYTEDPRWVERFVREARATAQLNHVNIVQGIDVGQSNNLYYFAMEYVRGESLRELLAERGRFAEREAAQIVLQAARALEHAWEFGFVHRDIKPDNLLLTAAGVVKLTDMGLAKRHEGGGSVTKTGSVVGTPNYISPEQARGLIDVDTRSDIYSLGITLFHLLAGRLPFADENANVVMARHINDPVPPVRMLCPEVSEELERILQRMTEKKLEWRYQRPGELAADLERYLAGGRAAPPPAQQQQDESAPVPVLRERQAGPSYRFCHVPGEEETWFTLIAVKSGLLTVEQVQTALELQEARAEVGVGQTLDELYVEKRYITRRHRERIRQVQREHEERARDEQFGEIGQSLGLFEQAQLEECRAVCARMAARGEPAVLADVMVARRCLTADQRQRVLAEQTARLLAQEGKRFGAIARACRLAGRAHLMQALELQEDAARADPERAPRIGEVLLRLGHMSQAEVQVVLRAKARTEMTGESPRELVEQMRVDAADPSGGDSSVRNIAGLFANVKLKGFDTEECPFCGSAVEERMRRCPRCSKVLE